MENNADPDGQVLSASASAAETPDSGESGRISGADDESGEGAALDLEASGDETSAESAPDGTASTKRRMTHVRLAAILGLVLVVVLGGLTGWLGYRAFQSHEANEERNLFVKVGRQGALNLTTIDWQHADADVQRILDSATGSFYDDFQQRSGPFLQVVKQAKSKSEGRVTEAGLESRTQNEGQVLVAVTVNTSNAGAAEQEPRSWRMRITVQKVNEEIKVSKVEFVP
jgi:Mce-associated membrane protein